MDITGTVANAIVRAYVEVQITLLEDLLEQLNDLKRKNVLSKIVVCFEDTRDDLC
jgi:hypothetical protein